jgi:thiol-disulfide isomerase/thioredoxin
VIAEGILLAAAIVAAGPPPAATTKERPLPSVVPADIAAVLAAIRRPGASAVLVNVWATWCDPCREEMPTLLRFYRERRAQGLRLVLVSADEVEDREKAARFLASQGVDFPSWLKQDADDGAFIDGLDRRWRGALPASFLFDGKGRSQRFWQGQVTAPILQAALDEILKQNPRSKDAPPHTRREP